jgi:polyphosphate kinase
VAAGAHPDPGASPVFTPPASRYINRELSRLDFDERVLGMAEDPKLPLLERVRFLAIFSQNIDDFFQVRVAGLKEQVLAAVAVSSPDGMSPAEQLKAIRTRVEGLSARQVGLYNREIVPALARAGIALVRADEVNKRELAQLHAVFREQIFPVLTPLAVDPGHPFPYISHLSLTHSAARSGSRASRCRRCCRGSSRSWRANGTSRSRT